MWVIKTIHGVHIFTLFTIKTEVASVFFFFFLMQTNVTWYETIKTNLGVCLKLCVSWRRMHHFTEPH